MKRKCIILLCLVFVLATLVPLCKSLSLQVFSSIRNKTVIVIDAGHGGSDPGKVSTNGIEEKNVNLEIASYLKDYLIAQDYTVYMTRETDCGLYDENVSNKKKSDLNNRIQFFKEKKAACIISIHQNSYPDTVQHGAQTFYFTGREKDKLFAETVQTSLLTIDDTNTRLAKSSDSYYLLKNTSVPAIIVECGFLSNPEETARLTDSNYQKQIAFAIATGTCNFLNKQ